MSPFLQNEIWVSDVEEDSPQSSPVRTRALIPRTGTLLIRHLKHVTRQLAQYRPHGSTRPELGQKCLIMKGKAGDDEGQVGIISDRTAAMVHVTYASDQHGGRTSKLKRPSSLIMLDPDVTLVQKKDGTIWIRQCTKTRGWVDGDGTAQEKENK